MRQKEAQDQRIDMERARGTADMQAQLAKSSVGVDIERNNANARKAQADGESEYIRETGAAKGAEVEAIGLARAKGYESQVKALGPGPTTIVNALNALAESKVRFVPVFSPNLLMAMSGRPHPASCQMPSRRRLPTNLARRATTSGIALCAGATVGARIQRLWGELQTASGWPSRPWPRLV